jgi:DNA mismatch endonuclease (patch repair protein)
MSKQQRADRLSPSERRALMSRIGSRDTTPELAVRRLLHAQGYRYVLHDARLPGRPDIVFPARRKVIFVHGCFWHGHDCGRGFKPLTRADFWAEKIAANRARDRRAERSLRRMGWGVMTVWECRTSPSRADALLARLRRFLSG